MTGLGRIGKGKGDWRKRLFRPEDGGMRAEETTVGAHQFFSRVRRRRGRQAARAGSCQPDRVFGAKTSVLRGSPAWRGRDLGCVPGSELKCVACARNIHGVPEAGLSASKAGNCDRNLLDLICLTYRIGSCVACSLKLLFTVPV
jgi:hypothetical protein